MATSLENSLRASKRLLKASEIKLHVIREPRTMEDVVRALDRMPIPYQYKVAALEMVARGNAGFCLPFMQENGTRHAVIFSDSEMAMELDQDAISPKYQKMLASLIAHHERGHALDPNSWEAMRQRFRYDTPREIIAFWQARETLRGERFADAYGMFHMIAELRPNLADVQGFMKERIEYRYGNLDFGHQTGPVLAALMKNLPEIHRKITENPNLASRHEQANHYTEKYMIDYVPSNDEMISAGNNAARNQRAMYERLREQYYNRGGQPYMQSGRVYPAFVI